MKTAMKVIAVLICAYLLIGLFHCALVSYLMAQLPEADDCGYCELLWLNIAAVRPLLLWPVDAVLLYIFHYGG